MLAQQLLNGLLLGATYALFALGFTLMFGVLRVINLTYGFYFSAGAFVALAATTTLGTPIWLALPLAAAVTGLVAIVVDTLLLTRLRRVKAAELTSLMVTLGAALALYAASSAWLGTDIRRFPPWVISAQAYSIGGVRITAAQLLILGATILIVGLLIGLMRYSRLGLSIRAVAEQPDAAGLMGINTARTAAIVSFLSGAAAGAAGVLIGLNFNAIQPYMGEDMMLRGFCVIIVGGLGNIGGALAAGLLLGFAEVFTAATIGSGLKEAVAFTILVLVLWIRPAGLFGRTSLSRA
jgi:branched-chain amino acid transport system permease protein